MALIDPNIPGWERLARGGSGEIVPLTQGRVGPYNARPQRASSAGA
jgi:hypothetical protein